jgi:hypothetical protein
LDRFPFIDLCSACRSLGRSKAGTLPAAAYASAQFRTRPVASFGRVTAAQLDVKERGHSVIVVVRNGFQPSTISDQAFLLASVDPKTLKSDSTRMPAVFFVPSLNNFLQFELTERSTLARAGIALEFDIEDFNLRGDHLVLSDEAYDRALEISCNNQPESETLDDDSHAARSSRGRARRPSIKKVESQLFNLLQSQDEAGALELAQLESMRDSPAPMEVDR